MQINLLKDIVVSFAGPSAAGVVDILHNKKNVNEFLIAKKLNLTINQTRNVLYRLADEGLVSFVRKKDSKKGGWYTYFWTLNSGKSLSKFKEKLEGEINNLEAQLQSRQSKTFYYCPNCNIEYSEENALTYDYTCPECGEVLEVRDSSEAIKKIENEIGKMKSIISELDAELHEVSKKEEKAKTRRINLEKKKKDAERENKRRVREREKRKLEKTKKKYIHKKKKGRKHEKKKSKRKRE